MTCEDQKKYLYISLLTDELGGYAYVITKNHFILGGGGAFV